MHSNPIKAIYRLSRYATETKINRIRIPKSRLEKLGSANTLEEVKDILKKIESEKIVKADILSDKLKNKFLSNPADKTINTRFKTLYNYAIKLEEFINSCILPKSHNTAVVEIEKKLAKMGIKARFVDAEDLAQKVYETIIKFKEAGLPVPGKIFNGDNILENCFGISNPGGIRDNAGIVFLSSNLKNAVNHLYSELRGEGVKATDALKLAKSWGVNHPLGIIAHEFFHGYQPNGILSYIKLEKSISDKVYEAISEKKTSEIVANLPEIIKKSGSLNGTLNRCEKFADKMTRILLIEENTAKIKRYLKYLGIKTDIL